MTTKGMPSYRNPPVSEVVIGLYFEPIKEFLVPHIGLFWDRIRSEFPTCEHQIPLAFGTEPRWVDSATGLPLPRVWFEGKEKTFVVQLQGDCFFVNWRKTSDDQRYPRFPLIIETYERYFGIFVEFLRANGLPEPKPLNCELTYVNFVRQGEGWSSASDISTMFKDFSWTQGKRFLPSPKAISWSSQFQLPSNSGLLTAKLSQVTRISDASLALRLEMVARGIGESKSLSDLRSWYDLAHEWIVEGFSDLTNSDAQKTLWEREDV